IDGMATLVTRTSMMHMNWPSSSTASMSQLPWGVVVSSGAGAVRVGRVGKAMWFLLLSPARRAGGLGGDSWLCLGFRDPAFEEAALGDGAGQRECLAVGRPGFGGAAEAAEEFGPRGVPVLVAGQVQAVDHGQGGGRAGSSAATTRPSLIASAARPFSAFASP